MVYEITSPGRYGVLLYIAPKILNQNEYTQDSDMYSVGIVICFAELMKKCWHKDPSERPSAEILKDILSEWTYELTFNKQTEDSLEFLNAD
ncbi:hypothetical protein Glove_300g25 [Diversispora epigaea]|uniref:Protein kinase domain-containing protein n=1 Tax=Diversispora epigaea TaxID=1348612 RepID=A0A397I006_9GLOM|nr:hypothetical protein Glove_300g25 [Diversispora epigaea]